ncbi:hypothetical protein N0V90_007507 [Kalmusia sp. IMI 367209]|nr:hypothetical protein N0V90_007507 [Kalmusia sp. IMI 367209]
MSFSACSPDACKLCDLLQFDDGERGGFASDYTGNEVLDFPDPLPRLKPLYATTTTDDYLRHPTSHLRFPCGDLSDRLPGLPALQAFADRGCDFAKLLRQSILEGQIDFEGELQLEIEYEWRNGGPENNWGLMALSVDIGQVMGEEEVGSLREDFVVIKRNDDTGTIAKWKYHVKFAIEGGDGNCAQWLDLEPIPADFPLCEENIKHIRYEIDHCLSECHPLGVQTFNPTRLLDLGSSEVDEIQLIETASSSVTHPYVALSYCWGPPEEARTQLKTERGTLDERKRCIPFSIMSPVMQDAVRTTRTLSYRYLWIDALCIIQDDKQDWEREAESMGRVYSNAILTLCALSSSSCNEGFLQRHSSTLAIPFRSSIDPTISGSYRLRAYPLQTEESRGFIKPSHEIDRVQSAWRTRAWTFQEYELSTRILFFGRSRIHLVCPASTWVEDNHRHENPKFLQAFVHHIVEHRAGTTDREELYSHWLNLLERYGDRKCTFASDKLPAISGIAKLMADAVGDTYIAGIWSGALPSGLLWSSRSPEHKELETHLRACDAVGLPSWSWASQTALFTHGNSLFWLDSDDAVRCECAELHAARNATQATLNPFGSASDAVLCVTGKTFQLDTALERVHVAQHRQVWRAPLSASTTAWIELDYLVHHGLKTVSVDLKMVLIASVTGLASPNQNLEKMAARMEGFAPDSPLSHSDTDDSSDSDEDSEDGCRHAWGLLLHPTANSGQYRRVGIFTTRAERVGGLAFFDDCKLEEMEVI